jgi:hypothetical protein
MKTSDDDGKKKIHSYFLIFLINALSYHQHEYVFETCHSMTTYLQFSASTKRENEKKRRGKKERREREREWKN